MSVKIRLFGRCVGTCIGAALLLGSAAANALTVTGLKGQGFDGIYGDYAPGGNCQIEPRVTIGDAGFTFRVNGKSVQPKSFEYAASFMGQSYDGIMSAFFPFPVSDSDYGRSMMFVNADEKPGVIKFEPNLGPGEQLPAIEANLIKASPFMLCKGTGSTAPPPPAEAPPPAAKATPVQWDNLRTLADKQDYNIDPFDNGAIASALRALIGQKMAVLQQNMSVTGAIKRLGSVYYTSGNAPHQGGMEQAYILMDANRRTVQVGLWERGKLTVYAPPSGRIALPADIQKLLNQSPPEEAIAAPGKPWEIVPVDGRAPLAYVDAAASPSIKSFSIFCDNGRPTMAMLLGKPAAGSRLTVSWVFPGGIVNVEVARSNNEGTFWQAYLTGSNLIDMLVRQSGSAYLRINGTMEGEALLTNSTATLRTALKSCMRI